MSISQPIYCLSSDDDDDDDSLLNGSFLRKRPVVTESSSSSSSGTSRSTPEAAASNKTHKSQSPTQKVSNDNKGSVLQRVMQQQSPSTCSPPAQQIQRQCRSTASFGSELSPIQPSHDADESDEECLEVLPYQKTPPSLSSSGPRLSFSGQQAKDPVNLWNDDDDNDSPLVAAQQSSRQRVKSERSSPASEQGTKPVAVAAPRAKAAIDDFDDDDDSSCCSTEFQMTSRKPASSALDGQQANVTTRRRPAPSSTLCNSSSRSGSSDDDSDDSFAQKCRDFQTRRKRARPIVDEVASTKQPPPKAKPAKATANKRSNENMPNGTTKPTAAEREAQKQAAKAAKQQEREAARLAKEREKQAAKEQREREKIAKQQAKEQAKRQRQEATQQNNQQRGRYANKEIGILLEPALLDVTQNPWKVQQALEESGFTHVQPYPAALSCNAIQFVRQEYLQGGAAQAVQDLMQNGPPGPGQQVGYEHIQVLGIVLEAHTLIGLIQGSDEDDDQDGRVSARGASVEDDDDYPKLEQWLFGLVAGWRAAWKKTSADRPRIILLLYKVQEYLDKLWLQHKRSGSRRGPAPPNSEQLHDAILWMLIQFQVESILCTTPEDVGHEIFKMTRLLAETPYAKQATDLQTIAKIPAHVSEMAPSFDRARDTWIRQLQQIPRMSADYASNISRHYPTALSLWKAYQDENLSTEEKQLLLANLFGSRNVQNKLSMQVYRALTSDDPTELLS